MSADVLLDRFIGRWDEDQLTRLGKLAVAAKRVVFDVWGGGWVNLDDTVQRRKKATGGLNPKLFESFKMGVMIYDYGATSVAILGTILMVTHEIPAAAAVPVMVLGRMAYGVIVGVVRETAFATGLMN